MRPFCLFLSGHSSTTHNLHGMIGNINVQTVGVQVAHSMCRQCLRYMISTGLK